MVMVKIKSMSADMENNNKIDIDFHSHILPGCDHGSDSLQTSLKQMHMAKNAGVNIICATPHFYPDQESLNTFLKRRKKCYDVLRESLAEDDPIVLCGAEVLVCDNIDKLKDLHKLCLENTNYLLIEMPFYKWSTDIVNTVERLSDIKDIVPVMAHADRYRTEDVQKIIDLGIDLQLNTSSLCNRFKNHRLKKWLASGYVIALGSDIHGTKVGYKDWIKCSKKFGNKLDCCRNPFKEEKINVENI